MLGNEKALGIWEKKLGTSALAIVCRFLLLHSFLEGASGILHSLFGSFKSPVSQIRFARFASFSAISLSSLLIYNQQPTTYSLAWRYSHA
ncbi:hypothetical protein DS66_07410 [Mesotoga sp. SC_3PWM13N19]|nr:hypothetical protein DS66_07410 [Mesotoga sp. SC_3PWM13N19]